MKRTLIIILTLLSFNTFADIYINFKGQMRTLEEAAYTTDGYYEEYMELQKALYTNQACYLDESVQGVLDKLDYELGADDEAAYINFESKIEGVYRFAYYDNFSWVSEDNPGEPTEQTIINYLIATFEIAPCKITL